MHHFRHLFPKNRYLVELNRSIGTLIVVLTVLVSGCDGNGYESADQSTQPPESDDSLASMSHAIIVSIAQQSSYAQSVPESDTEALSVASFTADTSHTEDCPGGGTSEWTYNTDQTAHTGQHNQCIVTMGAVTSRMNGHYVFEELAPLDNHTDTVRYTFNDLETRYSRGERFFQQTLNGTLIQAVTVNERAFYDSDMLIAHHYSCDGLTGNYTMAVNSATSIEYESGGFSQASNGSLTINGHQSMQGSYEIETLEPLRYHGSQGFSEVPYAGLVRITHQSGEQADVEYVHGGAFINGEFHTLTELQNLYNRATIEAFDCVHDPDGGGPGGSGTSHADFDVSIDGIDTMTHESYLAEYNEDIPLFQLLVGFRSPQIPSVGVSVHITLSHVTGPGDYAIYDPNDSSLRSALIMEIDSANQITSWATRWDQEGSGGVTITSLTEDRVAGYFTITALSDEDADPPEATRTMSGSFDLPLGEVVQRNW